MERAAVPKRDGDAMRRAWWENPNTAKEPWPTRVTDKSLWKGGAGGRTFPAERCPPDFFLIGFLVPALDAYATLGTEADGLAHLVVGGELAL